MTHIFIDLTENERHWDSDIPLRIEDHDGLSGSHMSLVMADTELMLTVTQMTTLHELLDTWMNSGPARATGGVTSRVRRAIGQLIEERRGIFGKLFGGAYKEATFIAEFTEHVRLQDLRFRVTGEEPANTRPQTR